MANILFLTLLAHLDSQVLSNITDTGLSPEEQQQINSKASTIPYKGFYLLIRK